MTNNFLYAADSAGPFLTFDGGYHMRRRRDVQPGRRVARLLRSIARRLPRAHLAATR